MGNDFCFELSSWQDQIQKQYLMVFNVWLKISKNVLQKWHLVYKFSLYWFWFNYLLCLYFFLTFVLTGVRLKGWKVSWLTFDGLHCNSFLVLHCSVNLCRPNAHDKHNFNLGSFWVLFVIPKVARQYDLVHEWTYGCLSVASLARRPFSGLSSQTLSSICWFNATDGWKKHFRWLSVHSPQKFHFNEVGKFVANVSVVNASAERMAVRKGC